MTFIIEDLPTINDQRLNQLFEKKTCSVAVNYCILIKV